MRNIPGSVTSPRVALVHDFLVGVRGAERVFLEICDMYREADVFSPIYDERGTEGRFAHREVHTSFLQRLRPTARTFRALLPLYPSAIESFDFSGYDLIVSSSSAWAHAVIPEPETVHVCYCHNPFRYAWSERHSTLAGRGPLSRLALDAVFRRWRMWDRLAAKRVDRYVTNSGATRDRIRAYYGREAEVVHPPVATERFRRAASVGGDYLIVSELMPHKRIDVAVRAFTRLGLPLTVVGGGPDERRLRGIAGPTVSFAGRAPDPEVARLLAGCRALVVTSTEEFGIAAVEAQAAGRPAIAYGAGGALETVVEGQTGTLWRGGDAELADAVQRFDADSVDPDDCVANAARFSRDVFRRGLAREVDEALARRRDERRPQNGRVARTPLGRGLVGARRQAT